MQHDVAVPDELQDLIVGDTVSRHLGEVVLVDDERCDGVPGHAPILRPRDRDLGVLHS